MAGAAYTINLSAPLDSAAGTIAKGMCVIANAAGLVVPATASNRASYPGATVDVSLTDTSGPGSIQTVAIGRIAPGIFNLGVGSSAFVGPDDTTGMLVRHASTTIGLCDTYGLVTLGPTAATAVSGTAINVKSAPYNAKGDGVADDTGAMQSALDAMMATRAGGTLYIPAGIYRLTYSLQLVGDYGHNFSIIGDGAGFTSKTTLKWNGPPGCTMLDCWGLNWTHFQGLIFDGSGQNIHIGGGHTFVGAGCGTWFHTNQYNTIPKEGSGPAACFGIFFDACAWQSIVGGLFAATGIGDGEFSPGDLTVDKDGKFTLYKLLGVDLPAVGQNAVDTVFTTTLTVQANPGDLSFTVADPSGFKLSRGIVISKAGQDAWCGRVSDITGNVITAEPNPTDGAALGYVAAVGTNVYNVYPNAVAYTFPTPDTIVNLPFEIQNSEVQGLFFSRCNWLGGGWDTSNAASYNYAACALYSGYNAEQFYWRDGDFFTQGGVYGIYSPTNPNNEFFVEDVQFGNFSGTAIFLGAVNFAKLNVFQCATESHTGAGYFVINNAGPYGGTTHIDGCEVVYNNICNPYTACVGVTGMAHIERTTFQNQYGGVGSDAQPLAIGTEGDLTIENCTFFGEEYQIPVFKSGNDLFSDYLGSQAHPGTNRTHKFGNAGNPANSGQQRGEFPGVSIRLVNNYGTNASGQPIRLRDVNYNPVQTYTVGPLTNPYAPGATETYRGQHRTTTSQYEVDYTQAAVSGPTNVYLFTMQPKTIVNRIVIETTQTFSSATTIDCGTQLGSYSDVFLHSTPTTIPTVGGLLTANPGTSLISSTWAGGGYSSFAVVLYPTSTLTSGHLTIYVTMEVVL